MENKMYECPVCRDSGYILRVDENGYSYADPCKCRAIKDSRERLRRSGLAKEFKSKTFDNFMTFNNPQLEDAKRTVMKYAEKFEEMRNADANSLMLCGQVGAGKTHLGTACSVHLIDNGIPVIYMGYREEMTALKSKVTDKQAYTADMNRYKKAPVLFIDDFLKGKVTEADVNVIYEIINYRYNNNLPVIISTEKSLDAIMNFDEAIGSRLIEMCRGHIIAFAGEKLNYRLYRGGAA